MINSDRIVPIMKVDLISMYGLILTMNSSNAGLTAVDANNALGEFEIAEADSPLIASEPVTSCDFGEDVSAATLYFVPSYDYTGFTANGAPITATGDVTPDGFTLYKAVLADSAVTITQIGF